MAAFGTISQRFLTALFLLTVIGGLGTVSGKPLDREAINPLQLSTFKGYHYDYSLGKDGVYKFAYSLPQSSRSEQRSQSGEVKGRYSFVAPEGDEFDFKYEAGRKGFQVESDALPAVPSDTDEVRQAKRQFFEAYKKALELVSSTELEGGYGRRRLDSGDDDDDDDDDSSEESSEEDDDDYDDDESSEESSEEDDDSDEESDEDSDEDSDEESDEDSDEESDEDSDEESDEDDDEEDSEEEDDDEEEEDEEDEDEEDEEDEDGNEEKKIGQRLFQRTRPVSRRQKTYSRSYFTPAPFRNYGNKNIVKTSSRNLPKNPFTKTYTRKPARKSSNSYKSSRSKTITTKRPYSKPKPASSRASSKRAGSTFKRPIFLSSLPTKRPTSARRRSRGSSTAATSKASTRKSYFYVK